MDANAEGAGLVAAYGPETVVAAVRVVGQARQVEPAITRAFVDNLPEGSRAAGLEHRLKSVESLARKVQKISVERFIPPGEAVAKVHDVVRYTVVSEADRLTETVKASIENLRRSGWAVQHAHHSYVDGNRYRGVQVALREPGGTTVEVEFHSEQSLAVKAATTRFSRQERDVTLPIAERAVARHHQIERADEIATPPGLEGLRELGGVAVATKIYPGSGSTRPHSARTSGTGQASGGSVHSPQVAAHRRGLADEAVQGVRR